MKDSISPKGVNTYAYTHTPPFPISQRRFPSIQLLFKNYRLPAIGDFRQWELWLSTDLVLFPCPPLVISLMGAEALLLLGALLGNGTLLPQLSQLKDSLGIPHGQCYAKDRPSTCDDSGVSVYWFSHSEYFMIPVMYLNRVMLIIMSLALFIPATPSWPYCT